MQPTVTFFVTTPRSATQWLAAALSEAYPDRVVAAHEPLGFRYSPCTTLRDPAAAARTARLPVVAAHFRRIEAILAGGRSYVEVGFPAFAMAPALRSAFGDRLRLVQMTRDPVRVAASLVTHRWYVDGARDDVHGVVALTPADRGVLMKDYAARWPDMSAFEKGLFLWAEIHAYGLEVEAGAPPGGFARFRAEGLLGPDPCDRRRLAAFLGLPDRAAWLDAHKTRVDRFHNTTTETIDPHLLSRHPEIAALAERLGHAARSADRDALATRYRRTSVQALRRMARRTARRIAAAVIG